jgi:flagellar hook-associated protein 3 FlgL
MLADTTLRNLNKTMERLDRLQDQLTSGQRISAPSDDPIGASAALGFRSTLGELEQYIRNIDAATSWLEATDSTLDSVTQLMQRARELGVQGANDTLSAQNKQAIAAEVQALIDQATALGNATYGGQYLFAGFRISTAPFSPVGDPPSAVAYGGDGGQILRQIDARSAVVVNIDGERAFAGVFTSLIGLRDDLTNGTSADVSARLSDLDQAIDTVLSTRSEVGARVNRLSGQKDGLDRLRINITGLLSQVQDTDMTEAITAFALQQNVYNAALAAGAKAIQPSLLDYLR